MEEGERGPKEQKINFRVPARWRHLTGRPTAAGTPFRRRNLGTHEEHVGVLGRTVGRENRESVLREKRRERVGCRKMKK